jgi:hypothetical protein
LSHHDTLADSAVGKGGNHFGKLADFEPNDLIDERGQSGVSLTFESDGHQAPDAEAPGFPGEGQRQRTVAGDDPENVRRNAIKVSDVCSSWVDRCPDCGHGWLI